MARRKTILATNEIYHVYNRGVEKRPIFLNRRNYLRFIELTNYYRFEHSPMKFSHFKQISFKEKERIFKNLQGTEKLVDVLTYCLMSNHFHFLLKQLTDKGISKFIAKVTNGFSHYFNTRHERSGHLFQGNFGAVRIETDEQLIHTNRYIHLNPVFSYLIKLEDLDDYEYSSYPEYLNKRTGFCNTHEILSFFKSFEDYKRFIWDQADYVETLEVIRHLILE